MGGEIVYTFTDEAPMLATFSLLPICRAFAESSGVKFELKDISVAGRILANFSEYLKPEQRVADALGELSELTQKPHANIIKLPNVSAALPQLTEAIQELQQQGYNIPNYPVVPKNAEEEDIKNRYAKVLGSSVNPVLREGNSDRRVAGPVKSYAQKNPHKLRAFSEKSRTQVAHMNKGDFFESEVSAAMSSACKVRIEHRDATTGAVTVLKKETPLVHGEVIDASFMDVRALRAFFEEQIENTGALGNGVLLSLHLKATMMKISDPIMFGHAVTTYYKPVFDKHKELFRELGVNANNGIADVYSKVKNHPKRQEVERDIDDVYKSRPPLAMVDSDQGITNLHAPNDVIIDASVPPVIRDGGKMWNAAGALADTNMMIPDRCYATMYSCIVEDCKLNGPFSVATMGNVSNVGLMAQKAEEYGSHDKTFEIKSDGTVRVVDCGTGQPVLPEHSVRAGDIWRMCQTKDEPIRDWVKLAVRRAKATGSPAVFWLDENRAHDATLITKVREYLKGCDTSGLDISIMDPAKAMAFTLKRVRRGENTISVTGNVLRDYLTDLFPILELGTSAKMLSIVPLLAGGGLFETGAGGSAPKHVQQLVKENHLRWDSLGEFLAIAASLEDLATKEKNPAVQELAKALDAAASTLLDEDKNPSRKCGELDNRGSHFYLAKYWAQELAKGTMASRFAPLAAALRDNEATILHELTKVQGKQVDLGGYYHPDVSKTEAVMRPSATFNKIIDDFRAPKPIQTNQVSSRAPRPPAKSGLRKALCIFGKL